MEDKFYAKGNGNNGYIKNLEVCSFNNLDGTCGMFQMALYKRDEKYYLYGCCFGGNKKNGVMISDITDPYNPQFIKHFQMLDPKEYPTTTTPKIQIADDLMIVAMSCGSGPGALVDQAKLANIKCEAGIRIYSLKEDPLNPKFLGYWDCGLKHVMGVHRFMYNGGRYVHLSSDCVGFEGLIYRVIDIINPTNPVEIGKWWRPDQYADGYPNRTFDAGAPHCPEFM
ncbi:hypothetical protein QC9_3654, partial [Clostridioides difficile CD39]